jgi:hypothetical protein
MKPWNSRLARWAVLLALWAAAGVAHAEAPPALGLTLDLGFATAYGWHDVDACGDRQGDPHAFVAPAIAPGLAASNGNRVDVALTVAAPIAVTEWLFVKPAVNAAWTDLDRAPDGTGAGVGDEAFVFGSVDVGVNL